MLPTQMDPALILSELRPKPVPCRQACPASPSVEVRKTPLAVVKIDTNRDGVADTLVVGPDVNNDGIPDVLQPHMVGPNGSSLYFPDSMFCGNRRGGVPITEEAVQVQTSISLGEPSIVDRRIAVPWYTERRIAAPPAIAGSIEVPAVVPVYAVENRAEPVIRLEDFRAEREFWSSRIEEIHTQREATEMEVMKLEVKSATQKFDNLSTMLKQHMATCEARFQQNESGTGAQLRQQGLEIEGARAQLQDLLDGGQSSDQADQYTKLYGMLEGIQDDQKALRRDVGLQIEELFAKTLTEQGKHHLLMDLHNKVVALEQRHDDHVGQVESRLAQHSRDLQQESLRAQQRNIDRVEADMRSQLQVMQQMFQAKLQVHDNIFNELQQREQVGANAAGARSHSEVAIHGLERAINDLQRHATDHTQAADQLSRRLRDLEAAIQTNIQDQTNVQEMLKQESMTIYDLRQSLTTQSDQTHQLGLQLRHVDARMEFLAQGVHANSARDLTEERVNRAENDISQLSLFLDEIHNKEAMLLHALQAESEQRALQISNLHQHLNQGLAQARAINHNLAVADAAVTRAATQESAAWQRSVHLPDARFVELKEWVNIELDKLRRQPEKPRKGPSPPPYPKPKTGQQVV